MDRSRLSLMTFPMDVDIWKKTMSVADIFRLAKQAKIPHVDVMNINKKDLELYCAAIQETGVRVYVYIMRVSFLGSCNKRNRAIEKGLKIADRLGAKYMMIVPYCFPDAYRAKKFGAAEVKKRMIEGFRYAVCRAKPLDIRVCFETTPHDASCLSGAQDCMDVLDAVSGLEFVFDTANMLPHGDDPLEAYEMLKDRISHVHLKDVVLRSEKHILPHSEHTPDGKQMKCVVWGTGIIPVFELYNRMIADGYQGQFAVEYVHPENGPCAIANHIQHLSSFFDVRK